jgi:hypothetical protein
MRSRFFLLALGLSILSYVSCNFQNQSISHTLGHDDNIGDRLWLWGHGEDTLVSKYNLPEGDALSPKKAADTLGISNICMIRWLGKPEPPYNDYLEQFEEAKRFAWSVIDSAPQPYLEKKKSAFEIAYEMPNLTTLYLDDFFIANAIPDPGDPAYPHAPAKLTINELKSLHDEASSSEGPLDIAVVLYSTQLNQGIINYLEYVDVVSFWTWRSADLEFLDDNFIKYRKLVPDKRTMLGIYMWDFGGGGQPVPIEKMEKQCNFALRKMKEGEIEGVIFHCSPICSLGIEAVEYVKKWIESNKDKKILN